MKENRRYWIIAAMIGVAFLLIAAFTTANWYRGKNKTTDPNASTNGVSDSLTVPPNKNLDNVSAEDVINRYLTREQELRANLLKELKPMEASGNGSLDYVKAMVSLNEATTLLSESYKTFGGNDETFKLLSQQTEKGLQAENETMKELMDKYAREEHKNEDMENAYLTDFNALVAEFEKAGTTDSSSLEHAFSQALMQYDQLAVNLSTSILEYTDYNEVVTMAQKIINDRKPQIEELKKLTQ